MGETVVQLVDVSKKIGRKTIIDGISFDIGRGEIFGLLGPNGAGKTTTIRMMVGLIAIGAGKILIEGFDIEKNFCRAIAHVGAIVENPEFYNYLTGFQNLVHYALMSPNVDDARIEEVVAFVGMEKRIHDPVRTYSLGMRQRLGIAQALLHRPSVLILDEPANGLDPAGIKELRGYLRKLAKEERVSVIISSHLLAEMELMCDRVAIIKKGRLLDIRRVGDLAGADQRRSQPLLVTFEVDNPAAARNLIRQKFSDLMAVNDGDRLEVNTNRETIAQINAALVQAGIKVYGIEAQTPSLEEVFMEVTQDGQID